LENPEIHDLGKERIIVAVDQEDVVGFQIAMDDAGFVRAVQTAQRLGHDVRRLFFGQPCLVAPQHQQLEE